MANQKFIAQQVEQLSKKLGMAKEEIVDAISQLTKGKSKKEIVNIINNLDINKIVGLKTAGIMAGYVAAQKDILLSKEFFAPISEEELQALLIASEQYFGANLVGMGGVIQQQVLSGIVNRRSVDEIVELIGKQGYAAHSLDRIVNDGMNNYSRAVSSFMMDEAPENTKYVYIGPADEKTREFCLQLMAAGEETRKEIRDNAWTTSLTEGGGVNCRHNWERASKKVKTKFHNKSKAQELIDNKQNAESPRINEVQKKEKKKKYIHELSTNQFKKYRNIAKDRSDGKISQSEFNKKIKDMGL